MQNLLMLGCCYMVAKGTLIVFLAPCYVLAKALHNHSSLNCVYDILVFEYGSGPSSNM